MENTHRSLRHSWPAKGLALSFIVLILLANFWVIFRLSGSSTPQWITLGFWIGVGTAIISGIFYACLAGILYFRNESNGDQK